MRTEWVAIVLLFVGIGCEQQSVNNGTPYLYSCDTHPYQAHCPATQNKSTAQSSSQSSVSPIAKEKDRLDDFFIPGKDNPGSSGDQTGTKEKGVDKALQSEDEAAKSQPKTSEEKGGLSTSGESAGSPTPPAKNEKLESTNDATGAKPVEKSDLGTEDSATGAPSSSKPVLSSDESTAATNKPSVGVLSEDQANKVAGKPTGLSVGQESAAVSPPVTYRTSIRPIIERECFPCHSGSGTAPTKLEDYQSVALAYELIELKIKTDAMPKKANPDDPPRKLSDADKSLFYQWSDAGLPEGDVIIKGTLSTSPSPDPDAKETSKESSTPQVDSVASTSAVTEIPKIGWELTKGKSGAYNVRLTPSTQDDLKEVKVTVKKAGTIFHGSFSRSLLFHSIQMDRVALKITFLWKGKKCSGDITVEDLAKANMNPELPLACEK